MNKDIQNDPIFFELTVRFAATGCNVRIGKITSWIVMFVIVAWRLAVALKNVP